MKTVVDTNIWISALLGGRSALPVLQAWGENKFRVIVSQPLIDEFDEVRQRSRLKKYINQDHAEILLKQLYLRGKMVNLQTVPPLCRDPKDHPVLATAIDGQADAIVSGDKDLQADDELRSAMERHGVKIWSIRDLLSELSKQNSVNQANHSSGR